MTRTRLKTPKAKARGKRGRDGTRIHTRAAHVGNEVVAAVGNSGSWRLSWQWICPYHRLSARLGCKKTVSISPGPGVRWMDESTRIIHFLKAWAVLSSHHSLQSTHVPCLQYPCEVPELSVLDAQCPHERPSERPPTDEQVLAAGETSDDTEDSSDSSSSDSASEESSDSSSTSNSSKGSSSSPRASR